MVLFLLYVGISIVDLRMQIGNSQASLEQENRALREQLVRNQEMEAMIAAGDDWEEIERIAREMGYIYPDEQVVILANGN